MFIGKNENQFQEDMSTSILEAKLREITMTLGHIASREENARDTLTKLPTRRYLLQNLDTYFKEALESQSHLSVVVIDLDKFKHVNDTYGHSVGDSVLKTFANVLASNLSNNDIKVRYGGEEFVVVSLASPQNTYIAMQRISQLFQSFTFGIDAN
ncbi:MAG: diguanylate cyclase domain-containing protein [Patescibacteria group bacterium]